ncbi:MAG TPA: cupin domain-containing protein [Woeseiaceae bacterium]|nr:cupin domain-containing protein [Woeseiaceae bacterium]
MVERMTPERALAAVAESDDGLYGVLLEHGTMELGYYRPADSDEQEPHEQDELYIVHTGAGVCQRGDERIDFGPGDALFVPAHMEHRFVEFSADFAAWVVFYGPRGGESAG